jgi:hypothetical protein
VDVTAASRVGPPGVPHTHADGLGVVCNTSRDAILDRWIGSDRRERQAKPHDLIAARIGDYRNSVMHFRFETAKFISYTD